MRVSGDSCALVVRGTRVGEGKAVATGSGPGSKRIAATVLEWLAVRGRSAQRDRAERALGLGPNGLADADDWLAEDAIAELFVAGEIDAAMARSLGHRLVAPDITGLRLYGLGLATPEKAFRRAQALLPRENARSSWTAGTIEGQRAELNFVPSPGSAADVAWRTESVRCAFRKGMLEAIPGLYGLLPGEVSDLSCRARGDASCRYQVTWQPGARSGGRTGLLLGLGVAAGVMAAPILLAGGRLPSGWPSGATIVLSAMFIVLGVVCGRVRDLRAQLEAIAGARRGQLAIFDQVDDELASKLDALARVEAKLEGELPSRSVRTTSSRPGDARAASPSEEDRRTVLKAAQQIHAAAGDLECWINTLGDAVPEVASGAEVDGDQWGRVREIREWAARIAEVGSDAATPEGAETDFARLVERGIATARPSFPPNARIESEVDADLCPVDCDAIAIEQVVVQLLKNAFAASEGLTDAPTVRVTLSNSGRSVELAVEDRGVGIDSTEIDEVFDPFFGDAPIGAAGGFGLPVCLRIVERHGGELRIENENRAGTRVSVLLPAADVSDSDEKE